MSSYLTWPSSLGMPSFRPELLWSVTTRGFPCCQITNIGESFIPGRRADIGRGGDRAIHDSIRSLIWIRTHGFSKSYNLELDPWENPHTDNPSRRLKYLRIYNSTAGHRADFDLRTPRQHTIYYDYVVVTDVSTDQRPSLLLNLSTLRCFIILSFLILYFFCSD